MHLLQCLYPPFLGNQGSSHIGVKTLQIKTNRLGGRLRQKGICLPFKLQCCHLFHYPPEAFRSEHVQDNVSILTPEGDRRQDCLQCHTQRKIKH